jgi:hypothetical protein
MATGTTVIAEVRDELQDTTDTSFGTAELLRYINRGATEFCATTGCLQDSTTINTDSTNFKFTLSTSLTNPLVVFAVEYAGVPLYRTYRHEVSYQFGASTGTPTAWYEFAGALYLDLIATTATGSDALTVFYVRIPTDMSAVGSTFDFPDEWKPAIVQYAMARCYASQRDTVLEAKCMAEYEKLRQSAYAINKWKLEGNAR